MSVSNPAGASPFLVLSTSLDPASRSRLLARRAHEVLAASHPGSRFIDLRESAPDLPLCDADACYAHPALPALREAIAGARGIALAFAVYNFGAAAAAKNLIELTGDAWEGKVVALLAAAGGGNSFMAPMSMAMSLMLDFRCIIIPRFVYAPGAAFGDGAISDSKIGERVDQLARELMRVANALHAAPG